LRVSGNRERVRTTTHELLVVHGLDGGVGRRLVGEGDEAEAARATRTRLAVCGKERRRVST